MSRGAYWVLIVLVVVDLVAAGLLAWALPQVRPGAGMAAGRIPGFWGQYARPFGIPRQGLLGNPFSLAGSPLWGLGTTVATEIFLFLGGGLVLFLFPGLMSRLGDVFAGPERRNVFLLLGIGLLAVLLLGALVGLAALSLLGLPAVPLLLLLMGSGLAVGLVASLVQVGRGVCYLLQLSDMRPLVHLLLGVATVSLVAAVPVLNGLVLLVAGVWGVGALLVMLVDRQGKVGSSQALAAD